MSESIERLVETWDGEAVATHVDQATGSWIFVAIHNTTLGPAAGGTRMKVYGSRSEALSDAMRLAQGMTAKWAAIEMPKGGGKAVIAVPEIPAGEARRGLFRRYAALLNTLHGAFSTGPDLGTTPQDMVVIGATSQAVHGVRDGHAVDPGPYTARGVLAGIQATVRFVMGGDVAGRAVLVQGVGDVGYPLARMLAEAGARILVSDVDGDRARTAAEELNGELVPPHLAYDVACDVYAPCAVGGTLNAESIPRLRCRLVAGSANNQLADPDAATRLHQRGIVYAPDYIVNAGGAIALVLLATRPESEARSRVDAIGDSLTEILREAKQRGESPVHAAERRVQRVLGRKPPA